MAIADVSPIETLDWSQVSKGFITDIKGLFPSAQLTEKGMKLTAEVIWLLSAESKLVLAENVLYSPLPRSMSVSQLREVWSYLAKLEGTLVSA